MPISIHTRRLPAMNRRPSGAFAMCSTLPIHSRTRRTVPFSFVCTCVSSVSILIRRFSPLSGPNRPFYFSTAILPTGCGAFLRHRARCAPIRFIHLLPRIGAFKPLHAPFLCRSPPFLPCVVKKHERISRTSVRPPACAGAFSSLAKRKKPCGKVPLSTHPNYIQ